MLRASPVSRALSRWWGRLDAEHLALVGLAVVGFAVVVLVHPGRIFVDTRFDLYLAPLRLFQDTLSTWVGGSGLGTANYNTGFLPVATVMSLLHLVGIPAWLTMRLWRYALLVIAAWGARALLRDLVAVEGQVGPVGRVMAAVLYVANPYVVVGAATTPVMVPYAFFPWLLLALRRSFHGSRWAGAAAFGLTMFFVGGINAGVVPAFLMVAVVPVALDAWRREGVPIRTIAIGLGLSGLATVLVSAYWLAGTASAFGTASAVADATEDPRTVASVSSFAEVMRGLGSWLVYGGDSLGPYRPGFVSFLTSPAVVVATFVLPVLAILGAALTRWRVRRLFVALTVLGLTLMVGGYPPDDPSPFGRALLWSFDHVPGAVAFRTTSKAGAIAMLGMAYLAALGIDTAWKAWRVRDREVFGVLVALGLVVSLTPVWLGKLLPGELPIPGYWQTAAEDLDANGADGRVWALPGETNAFYRWRPFSVDDIANSLLSRPVVYAHSYPDGPVGAWNAMAGVAEGLDDAGSTGSIVSTYAHYLGASDVLVRNDMVWNVMGVPRPAVMDRIVNHDPGLEGNALYGHKGANVTSGQVEKPTDDDVAELGIPPLERWSVTEPTSLLQIYPTSGQLLVAGDNAAVPSAIWAGLLDGHRPFRLLADTSSQDVSDALAAGGRLLLTDTNRRREANFHRLDSSGPLVSAGTPVSSTRALGEPDDQTVASYSGIASVTASASGSVFGPTSGGRPFLAFDGDPQTAWQFGDFHTGRGATIAVTFDQPRRLTAVTVSRTPAVGGPQAQQVQQVVVSAGGLSAGAGFTNTNEATATFAHAVMASRLTLRVTGLSGSGNNGLGIAEIGVPGLQARESDRMPRSIADLAADPATSSQVSHAPVDVLLTRAGPEGEQSLVRDFDLPSDQGYTVRAEVVGDRDAWQGCHPLATVDGHVLRARASHTQPENAPGIVEVHGCSGIALDAGSHHLESVDQVDRLLLTSSEGQAVPAAGDDETSLPFWHGDRASYDVQVPASDQSRYLVLAQGYDPRWHAVVDGQDLGTPVELNGFAIGWRLPAGQAEQVHLFFGPQGRYRIVLVFSLLCVLGLVAVVAGSRRRTRSAGRR